MPCINKNGLANALQTISEFSIIFYSGTAPTSLSISSLLVTKQFFVFFVPAPSLQVETTKASLATNAG